MWLSLISECIKIEWHLQELWYQLHFLQCLYPYWGVSSYGNWWRSREFSRDPLSLVDQEEYNAADPASRKEMLQKVKATATRNIFLIRHGQYFMETEEKNLTPLGKFQRFSQYRIFCPHLHRIELFILRLPKMMRKFASMGFLFICSQKCHYPLLSLPHKKKRDEEGVHAEMIYRNSENWTAVFLFLGSYRCALYKEHANPDEKTVGWKFSCFGK